MMENNFAVLKEVSYPGVEIGVFYDQDRPYLQVQAFVTCTISGKSERHSGRKWFLSPHMTRSEVVQTALKAILAWEEHEVRERFTYRGKAIFGPHFDVDALYDAAGKVDIR